MKRPRPDPSLHLFLDDSELSARHRLWRVTQTFRRDRHEPVLVCDRPWEGTAVGTLSVLYDAEAAEYKMWYLVVKDRPICLAVSTDGETWTKPDLDVATHTDQMRTNIVHARKDGAVFAVEHAPDLEGLAADTRFLACEYLADGPPRSGTDGEGRGIYALSSPDGIHWDRRPEPILRAQGDRTTLYYDPLRRLFMLLTRHRHLSTERRSGVAGLKRDIGLWESPDFVHWQYHGTILRPDDYDEEDTEFYGMSVFRYGNVLMGLLLVYYRGIEKLDVELAWSRDGRAWQRVGRRAPCFSFGGEGSWDSHWVQASHNPPQVDGDRMRFWYNGGNTKHGSGDAHRKSVGVASLRVDGFVSLDAGREEGVLVTDELPCEQPKLLTVNGSFPTGKLTAELLDLTGAVLEGYAAENCSIDGTEGTRLAVRWNGQSRIRPGVNAVKLRLRLHQGSLFSYRWSDAQDSA
jgi:hypothetical protein